MIALVPQWRMEEKENGAKHTRTERTRELLLQEEEVTETENYY